MTSTATTPRKTISRNKTFVNNKSSNKKPYENKSQSKATLSHEAVLSECHKREGIVTLDLAGKQVSGALKGFDAYSVTIETGDSCKTYFKHSIESFSVTFESSQGVVQ